ncbi:MAG: hypothetical protein ACFFD4_23820 [Candidatus Odinarchaeota archaeon]
MNNTVEITETSSGLSPRTRSVIITAAAIIVLFLPYGYQIDIGPGPNGFMAILWELKEFRVVGQGMPGIEFLTALEYFIYYLYRFVVLHAIWKYSTGKEKPGKLVIHGFIGELIPLLIDIPAVLILEPGTGHNYIPIMVPIPFLFIYCLVLVLFDYKRRNFPASKAT